MRTIPDPGASAHSTDGVDRAGALAANIMSHLIEMTGAADTDTAITSMFMLVEVLAGLEVYAGVGAAEAVARIEHLTAAKVAALWADEDEVPGERIVSPPPRPAAHPLH